MKTRLFGGLVVMAVGGLFAAACEEDPECETNADCDLVVCPDGVEHKACTDGACFHAEDCGPATPGGW